MVVHTAVRELGAAVWGQTVIRMAECYVHDAHSTNVIRTSTRIRKRVYDGKPDVTRDERRRNSFRSTPILALRTVG